MAKIRGINQKAKYAALNKRLEKYLPLVQSVYDRASRQMANAAVLSGFNGEGQFSFSDFPELKGMVSDILKDFRHDLSTTILTGTSKEWANSNVVQDMLADKVLKAYTHTIDREKYKQYYQPNNDAYKAFIIRKEKGFTLSSKIWDQSYSMRKEMEDAISVSIEKGMSAVTLSKKISKYLADYPSLQKDYKEKYGKATRSENCEYRSMRLARSEINMAYRTAEQERWREFDFVLGYQIKTSGSHPASDMCDILQGVYPKDFEWTGWHPNCMCYEIPILMNEDQFLGDEDAEYIDDVPDNFKEWVVENEDRINAAEKRSTEPYFIGDNKEFVKEAIEEDKKLIEAENKTFSEAQIENHKELEKALGIERGHFMDHDEADTYNVNPNYTDTRAKELGYASNCQTCTPVYELRRRGFDIEALPNKDGDIWKEMKKAGLEGRCWFIDEQGKEIKYSYFNKTAYKDLSDFFNKKCNAEGGRYEVYVMWHGGKSSHVLSVRTVKNVRGEIMPLLYCPQSNDSHADCLKNLENYAIKDFIGIRRVDNALINPFMFSRFKKK